MSKLQKQPKRNLQINKTTTQKKSTSIPSTTPELQPQLPSSQRKRKAASMDTQKETPVILKPSSGKINTTAKPERQKRKVAPKPQVKTMRNSLKTKAALNRNEENVLKSNEQYSVSILSSNRSNNITLPDPGHQKNIIQSRCNFFYSLITDAGPSVNNVNYDDILDSLAQLHIRNRFIIATKVSQAALKDSKTRKGSNIKKKYTKDAPSLKLVGMHGILVTLNTLEYALFASSLHDNDLWLKEQSNCRDRFRNLFHVTNQGTRGAAMPTLKYMDDLYAPIIKKNSQAAKLEEICKSIVAVMEGINFLEDDPACEILLYM